MRADMEVLPGKTSKIPIEKKYDQRMEAYKSISPPLYAPQLLNKPGLVHSRVARNKKMK